jgi:ubiquinone/menaquinone biosynthesis C-methylase UbiE
MDDPNAVLKQGVKWMWSLGHYPEMAAQLQPGADDLADECAIEGGAAVLDVAAGTGNFAVVAARRGAKVVASDLTPHMVELGRARTQADGLAVEWHEADAEALPFPDGEFDLAASVFGAMFAPRPQRVASELVRVVRPGGLVAMANYTAEGFIGALSEFVASHGPERPEGLVSPFDWADPAHVQQRFDGLGVSVQVGERTGAITFDSAQQGWESLERSNGPLNALKHFMPADAFEAVCRDGVAMLEDLNRAKDGGVMLPYGYLLVLARRVGGR